MICGETIRNDGRRRRSFPKRVGVVEGWFLQYSSKALNDFSCMPSIRLLSVSPGESWVVDGGFIF